MNLHRKMLSAGQRTANARYHTIPLALFGCWIIYQDTVQELTCDIAAVVPDLVIAEMDTTKKFGVTRL